MKKEARILQLRQSVPRIDAYTKVTGREKYAADYYGEGFLWAGVKRAGIPHARLQSIHVERALHLPGVVAVLTHEQVRGSNRQGVTRKDQPVLVDDKVRHCGDPVALVVAEDQRTLARALASITLDLEPLSSVLDLESALRPDSPLVHEDNPTGNILLHGELETGRGEAALAECPAVAEIVFAVPYQEHAYLETECGWAVVREGGGLELVASTQTPFRDRAEVADALGLAPEKIRIIAPHCGGGFGGKDGITVQSLLGLAALHAGGRPVKMWWEREESFLAGAKRHPGRLHYRLGADADGTFRALAARVYFDTGPYDHLGGAVLALALEHAGGPYRIPHVSIEGWSVYTNNPVGGAFRGFGVPQVTAAMEQTVDLLAAKLGLCPLELRRRNAGKRGDKNPLGMTFPDSTGVSDCLDRVALYPLWQKRTTWKTAAGPFKRRGVGLASVMHGIGYGPIIPDYANAKIELTATGTFRIFAGVVDMGQGNTSTYLQIAGDLLQQDSEHLELVLPDTERTFPSGSSSASRTTFTFGNGLIRAAHELKERILRKAAERLVVTCLDELALSPGKVLHRPSGRALGLAELASLLSDADRSSLVRYQCPVAQETPTKDEALRFHGVPHLVFSYGAQVAAVEVDELTGQIEVRHFLTVSDCGTILNPQTYEQQIQGGVAQGLGYALCEEFLVEEGRIKTPNLSTYVIPTALDVPDLDCLAVETYEASGPLGLKGMGEMVIDGPLAAVANALADACGIRIARSPFTAERVRAALTGKKNAK